MEPLTLNTGTQQIGETECMELLATEELGRLGVVVNGLPEIFPVNYVVDGNGIVFRTDGGTKLLGATHLPLVFEVDHVDRVAGVAWSVIVHGWAHATGGLVSAVLQQRISQVSLYPGSGSEKPFVLRIRPTSITGRQITTTPRAI
jgi:hypothetical protein